MADANREKTFKHRNIIDDILDLGLTTLMVVWYFTGIQLDNETLAMVGAAGASARVTLRKILVKFWGPSLGIDSDETEPEPAPSETPTENATEGEEKESEGEAG